MKGEIMIAVSHFIYLGSDFSKDGGLQEEVKNRLDEGLKS